MHETAMQHVLKLKLSVWDLEPLNLAWVLTQIKVNVHRLPVLGETVEVVTHPSGFERVRTYRDYRIYDQDGHLLASAVSQWFLMNTETRRLSRVPEKVKATIVDAIDQVDSFLERTEEKLPAFEAADLSRAFKVGYHDLDFNTHLNNIYYAKWMLDALPFDFLKSHQLRFLHLSYKSECTIDETIMADVQRLDNQQYLHQLSKEGKAIAAAKSSWIQLS